MSRVVVITGAGGVLCSSFAKELAKKGDKIAVLDLNIEAAQKVADEIVADGGIARAYKCNVLEKESITQVHKAVNEDLTDLLHKIKVETLLIWGENDTATPISDAKKMEELIPNAGLAVIANAGHFCFLEQRVIFDRIMKSYFKIGE